MYLKKHTHADGQARQQVLHMPPVRAGRSESGRSLSQSFSFYVPLKLWVDTEGPML